jgi:hypothetical protein
MAPGNTKRESIIVPLTSCLTGLESAVWQLTIFDFICKTNYSNPVKQEVNGTVILPPLIFPDGTYYFAKVISYEHKLWKQHLFVYTFAQFLYKKIEQNNLR